MCKNGKAVLGFGTLLVIGKGFEDGVEKFVIAPKKTAGTLGITIKKLHFPFYICGG